MAHIAECELEEAKSLLRDATFEFEAAKASGDPAKIEDARRQMGEAFGNLVDKKEKTRPASWAE